MKAGRTLQGDYYVRKRPLLEVARIYSAKQYTIGDYKQLITIKNEVFCKARQVIQTVKYCFNYNLISIKYSSEKLEIIIKRKKITIWYMKIEEAYSQKLTEQILSVSCFLNFLRFCSPKSAVSGFYNVNLESIYLQINKYDKEASVILHISLLWLYLPLFPALSIIEKINFSSTSSYFGCLKTLTFKSKADHTHKVTVKRIFYNLNNI